MSIVKHHKSSRGSKRAPIVCKTWKEYGEMLRKNFTPVAHGPKGQPIYNLEETEKRFLPPCDESR
jgi:hypothetical protein